MNELIALAWPIVALVGMALCAVGLWRVSAFTEALNRTDERIMKATGRISSLEVAKSEGQAAMAERLERLEKVTAITPVTPRPKPNVDAFR